MQTQESPNSSDALVKEVTSSRKISEPVRYLLWGHAAGHCQFSGCNKPLWKHPETQEPVNIAQAAHIYAFSAKGSRGNDGIENAELNEFENLLLVCHACHKTIDSHQEDGGRYPIELLHRWKAAHEERIERVVGIDPDHKSHVILYDRAIGGMHSPVRYEWAGTAMFPRRYPAENQAIELASAGSDSTEKDSDFWATELRDLERKFDRKVQDRLANDEIEHLSIFALAPMPLLIRLGTLLTDIRAVETYQLHRDPKGWTWPNDGSKPKFQIEKPSNCDGSPALVIALSATIDNSRIHQVLGENASIWRITLNKPSQECIRSREDLVAFCAIVRPLLNEIKAAHGHDATLSIFPASPASTMVELGRVRQPKADLPWIIYDENRTSGGFIKAVKIS